MRRIIGMTWIAALLLPGLNATEVDRQLKWKEVNAAIESSLPRTAIERLDEIVRDAVSDEDFDEALRAMGKRVSMEAMIEGDEPANRIRRFLDLLETAPKPMRPLLETLVAEWFWQYFNQNRWRFTGRTATAEPSGEDFTTWDLPRLFAEIDRHFTAALAADADLKQVPIADWGEVLEAGTMPDRYRPTLYDFVVHEALGFYQTAEQAAAQPDDVFTVSADTDLFAPMDQFIAWNPPASGAASDSPQYKAIRLYQRLLTFHRSDDDPSARLQADLDRILFAKNVAVGESVRERFHEAIDRFIREARGHELESLALHHRAQSARDQEQLVAAHRFATDGANRHPESAGGKLCRNLIAEIEAPWLAITAERLWNKSSALISVRYRNVERIHFRVVSRRWESDLNQRAPRRGQLGPDERRRIMNLPPAASWTADLEPTDDYRQHTAEFGGPDDLPPGYYFVFASPDPDFVEADNVLSMTDVWVGRLNLIVRPRAGYLEGFVVDAITGDPVEGATVDAWKLERNGARVAEPSGKTDSDGFFSFEATAPRQRYHVRARKGDDAIATANDIWFTPTREESARDASLLFTDRAIYRPGQTIHFKGICYRLNPAENDYITLPNRALTVRFQDANGAEIAVKTFLSNDYGSFHGTFTAPDDRLPGRMSLQIISGPAGAGWVTVEDYKRPRFFVSLNPPKDGGRLEETVVVSGIARTYSDAPIDQGSATYRITREAIYPWWNRFSRRGFGFPGSDPQEIAHGSLRTETDGSFQIQFDAAPDPRTDPADDPTFVFNIQVDVTDSTGETRSAQRRLRLGYRSLDAAMSVDEWLTADEPVTIRVTSATLDGQPRSIDGVIRIYALEPPDQIPLPRLPGWPQSESDGEMDDDSATGAPESWPQGPLTAESGFTTDADGGTRVRFNLGAGMYRAVLETLDPSTGKRITAPMPIHVLDPNADRLDVPIPFFTAAETWSVEPGDTFKMLWGTGHDRGRACVEIEHRHKILRRFWTDPNRTLREIRVPITASMRGGFTVHIIQVRDNRHHQLTRHVDVPWSNKDLDLRWDHFTSKLTPNHEETWTLTVSGRNADRGAIEMAATLYDASLDEFIRHAWPNRIGTFYRDQSTVRFTFSNEASELRPFHHDWRLEPLAVTIRFRHFPEDFVRDWINDPRRLMLGQPAAMAMRGMAVESAAAPGHMMFKAEADSAGESEPGSGPDTNEVSPDLNTVGIRRNLTETAFFYPNLLTDEDGVIRIRFKVPEALTEWRLLGLAHDRQLRSGTLTGSAITAKDLMVQPNPPRFLREGDALAFTVKVLNRSDRDLSGQVRLTFMNALNEESADADLGNRVPARDFSIAAGESRTFAWRLSAPENISLLTYRAVASTGSLSDGEEGFLPILSRRILVTESMPIPIPGAGQFAFTLEQLAESAGRPTLRHEGLTLQMASNPAWYAVLALPYLMEFPHECSEQTFNRVYANALARAVATSDPRIERVFEQWRNTPALESPLEKNEDLKKMVLEATPWLEEGRNESQARRDVGLLFDVNRVRHELDGAMRKLAESQLENGVWSWFPNGRPNDYITLYITSGFGRLRHLGVDIDVAPAIRALTRLDAWIAESHQRIKDDRTPEQNHLTAEIAFFLYGRSFFLKDSPPAGPAREAIDFFLTQARDHWTKLGARQSQGHLALALHRFDDPTTSRAIVKSIAERAVTDPELGMFWRDTEPSWWWYRAPIETQALMIEMFREVTGDARATAACQTWLLKQKQTRNWQTTKATADAVYAVLLGGFDVLSSAEPIRVHLGGTAVVPDAVEAGTGFFEHRIAGERVRPDMARVAVEKADPGISWGILHWTYSETVDGIEAQSNTPLKLTKKLFTRTDTSAGPRLEPVSGALDVGAELVVRIELRVDRDMEYIHLKDQRGSGVEPVNVLSGYRYQDGLAYYEAARDTATHFFIDYLPKGVYVFEYAARIVHEGVYESGIAEIQCMYAPEFNSHSDSRTLRVGESN